MFNLVLIGSAIYFMIVKVPQLNTAIENIERIQEEDGGVTQEQAAVYGRLVNARKMTYIGCAIAIAIAIFF